jgi:lipopolysaccharide export system protein LptA
MIPRPPVATPLRVIILAAAALLSAGVLTAQEKPGKENAPVVLDRADSLVGLEIGGEPARELVGNVQFTQGTMVLNCSRAIQYLRSNKVFFEGMVQARDDSVRLVGQRAVYYSETRTIEAFDRVLLEEGTTTLQARYGKYSAADKRAWFSGNVVVADTSTVLTAGKLTYDRDKGTMSADSNVRIEDLKSHAVTTSDHFENDRTKKYSRWTGNPRLVQSEGGPDAGPETLRVSGVTMESFGDTARRLVVTDSVRFLRDGLAGSAGLAVFHSGSDSIALYREPYLWYEEAERGENQVSGDSVIMKMRKGKAERVRVMGGAMAVSEADSVLGGRYNQLSGQEIIMYFEENRLGRIDVNTTATSLYYLFEEGLPNGLNRSSGDRVSIRFRDGTIDSITLTENVEGKYVPERMVKGKEADYNLPGFRWRTDRPGASR